MDLSPFKLINPCGLARMQMTQIVEQVKKNPPSLEQAGQTLSQILVQRLKSSPL